MVSRIAKCVADTFSVDSMILFYESLENNFYNIHKVKSLVKGGFGNAVMHHPSFAKTYFIRVKLGIEAGHFIRYFVFV